MIGPQVIPAHGLGEFIDDIQRWQPKIVVLVDPAPGDAAAVLAVSPNTFIVCRVWRKDSDIHNAIMANPRAAAKWARECIAPLAAGNREAHIWQFANEVCQTSVDEIKHLSDFSIAYIDELATIGLKAAIGGFSVGNPKHPQEAPEHWAAFYPAMRYGKPRGAVLLMHAYGAKKIYDTDKRFYLHRYELMVIPFLPDDLKDMPYCYGEYGSDLGILHFGYRAGWKTGYMGNARQYVADLVEAAQFLAQYSQCLGAAIFTLGTFGDWEDFNIKGEVARLLSEVVWPQPVEVPVPMKEIVRLRIPYVSQLAPKQDTDYAFGDCLQAMIAALIRALVRMVKVDELAEMTGLPAGYTSSDIIKHGVNLIAKFGIRMIWQGKLEPEDLMHELRQRFSIILRVWYPYLEKKFDPAYENYHFIQVTGFEFDPATGQLWFFYDDPYWTDNRGEDIRISATALRRAMWRALGGSTPAQGLVLRSHTLPLVGETPAPQPEPEVASREKLLYEASVAEDRQKREGRPGTAKYIRDKWFTPALTDPEAA